MSHDESIRELVQKYRVCYEVSNEMAPVEGGVRPIGFAIEIAGAHDHDPSIPLGQCDACSHVAGALQQIAHAAIPAPGASAEVSYSLQGPRMAHHFSPKRGNRADLTATISILHQGNVQRALDPSEANARNEVVERLHALGVQEGSWRE